MRDSPIRHGKSSGQVRLDEHQVGSTGGPFEVLPWHSTASSQVVFVPRFFLKTAGRCFRNNIFTLSSLRAWHFAKRSTVLSVIREEFPAFPFKNQG
jgi:hypothetical protein